jgi:peroxiredoxin
MRRLWYYCWLVVGAGALAGGAADDPVIVKEFSLLDTRGQAHGLAEWRKHKAVVLLFLGTECPVSNGYAPEYVRLAKMFAPQGIGFYGIHPDPDVTAAQAARHAAEHGLPFPILLDPRQVLTRQVGVKVVPEAAVLSPAGRLLYLGRIDDRYALDGRRREEPKTHDLENALRAVVAGRAPAVARTAAFGCPLPEPQLKK